MRVWKVLSVVFVAALGVIQLYPRTEHTNPPVTGALETPPGVDRILRRACYDCHSNETRWPWYSYVAPFSWLVVSDVDKARSRLNLSTLGAGLPERYHRHYRLRMLERMQEGEMPPSRYTLLHPAARLGEEDIEAVRVWAEDGREARAPAE